MNYENVIVIKDDAFKFIEKCRQKFDIIFADPPYIMTGLEKIVETVFEKELLNPDGWLILEHPRNYDFTKHPQFYQHRKYGKLNFSFLTK